MIPPLRPPSQLFPSSEAQAACDTTHLLVMILQMAEEAPVEDGAAAARSSSEELKEHRAEGNSDQVVVIVNIDKSFCSRESVLLMRKE